MFSAGVLLLCDVSLIQCSGRILTISTEQIASDRPVRYAAHHVFLCLERLQES
jgi:hypothetical protein